MIVYSVLFGDYESLTEQPISHQTSARFVLLTDNPNLTSSTWEIRVCEPALPFDAVRSARHPKVLPHLYFPNEEKSLYIDNSVQLKSDPTELANNLLKSKNLGMMLNVVYPTFTAEIAAVSTFGLDDAYRINEYFQTIVNFYPSLLDSDIYWAGIIARNHLNPAIIQLDETWWKLILRFSRRDQLSFPLAQHLTNADVSILEGDPRFANEFNWPSSANRNRDKYLEDVRQASLHPILKLSHELAGMQQNLDKSEQELLQFRNQLMEVNQQLTTLSQENSQLRQKLQVEEFKLKTIYDMLPVRIYRYLKSAFR